MLGMFDVSEALAPVATAAAVGLERVRACMDEQLRSEVGPMAELCGRVEKFRGKMLRPVVVLLTGMAAHPRAAKAAPGELIGQGHVVSAAVCELIHLATLVHDDVLDEAEVRRHAPTINRLHGNEAAVMLGDYLFAAAYHLCSTLESQHTARVAARASLSVCAGELLQLHHRGDYTIGEKVYDEIVSRKTGALIAAAAELGAFHSGAAAEVVRAMAEFGRLLGVAFQVQDDLLDLEGREEVVGKSVQRDVAMGKATLPLIHHLATATEAERLATLGLLERAATGVRAPLGAALARTGSVEYARQRAERVVAEAKGKLEALAPSPAGEALRHMADAVLTRRS